MGVFIGVLFALALPTIKGFFSSSPATGDEDDSVFDGDEQIKIPDNLTNELDNALFVKYPVKDLKMMLAVRTDLGMTKGKLCA